jgi:hypothetical protein
VQKKRDGAGNTVRIGEKMDAYRDSLGKTDGKTQLGISRLKSEDTIKWGIK